MNIEMAREILKSPLPKKGLFGVTLARTYLEGFEEGVRKAAFVPGVTRPLDILKLLDEKGVQDE